LPSAHAEDDRADEGGGECPTAIQAVRAISEEGDYDSEEEAIEKLHSIYDWTWAIEIAPTFAKSTLRQAQCIAFVDYFDPADEGRLCKRSGDSAKRPVGQSPRLAW